MNRKRAKGWLKHWDFILLDIICLQLCFMLSYWLMVKLMEMGLTVNYSAAGLLDDRCLMGRHSKRVIKLDKEERQ